MKLLKNLYYEFIFTRLIDRFLSYLESEGYYGESDVIRIAMISWTSKAMQRLKKERK